MFTVERFETLEAQQARVQEILGHEIFQLQNSGEEFQILAGTPEYGFCSLDMEYVFDCYGGETLTNSVRRNNLYTEHQWRDLDMEEKLPNWRQKGTYYREVLISYEAGYDEETGEYKDIYYVIVPHDLPSTSEQFIEQKY